MCTNLWSSAPHFLISTPTNSKCFQKCMNCGGLSDALAGVVFICTATYSATWVLFFCRCLLKPLSTIKHFELKCQYIFTPRWTKIEGKLISSSTLNTSNTNVSDSETKLTVRKSEHTEQLRYHGSYICTQNEKRNFTLKKQGILRLNVAEYFSCTYNPITVSSCPNY